MTFLCNSKLDVAGCKIWAQQYEECYQTSHKDQANFCEATLLSAGIILLPHTTVLCLSNNKLSKICWSLASVFSYNREGDLNY